jgi:hypothetical protein
MKNDVRLFSGLRVIQLTQLQSFLSVAYRFCHTPAFTVYPAITYMYFVTPRTSLNYTPFSTDESNNYNNSVTLNPKY